MLKAYKTEINPTDEQKIKISRTIGVCRFVYNLYLGKEKEQYEQKGKFLSAFDFSKYLNNEYFLIHPEHIWVKDVSSKAVKQSIVNGEKAFKKFFVGLSGYPRFKTKKDSVKAYFPKNSKTDFYVERHKIKVPTIGWLRLKEFGYIPIGADVSSCTLSKEADKYFISVLCKVELDKQSVVLTDIGVGVDLGIKTFIATSDGKEFKNINKTSKIKKFEKKLKREQRSLSRKKKKDKTKSSTNRKKNILRIQILHRRLKNIRKEYIRSVVNSLVKNSPKFITIEDLNVRGMLKNRHLSKAIQQQEFYYFRIFLIQQCKKFGIEVRVIDRWYPSSKLCRKCGNIKSDLKLSDRIYICECGHKEDRDLNASINIRDCQTYNVAQ